MYNSLNSNKFKRRFLSIAFFSLVTAASTGQAKDKPVISKAADKISHFSLGNAASPTEIAGWDIDVRPDGLGLPAGEGSVEDGESLYEAKCAVCHGTFGEGEGRWPKLAGGAGTLKAERPEKTVGSYWPYASTLWDYIRRAMPFPEPQSLSVDEVYAITAYVLNLNDLVDDDFVLNQANFKTIKMPNEDGFFVDDRPDIKNKRCMKNCKNGSKITIREAATTTSDDAAASSPQEPTKKLSAKAMQGKVTYESACKVCHDIGVSGAPKFGDNEQWSERTSKGIATLYSHAVKGFQGEQGFMPPKGGRMELSDNAVKEAVDFMVESSR